MSTPTAPDWPAIDAALTAALTPWSPPMTHRWMATTTRTDRRRDVTTYRAHCACGYASRYLPTADAADADVDRHAAHVSAAR